MGSTEDVVDDDDEASYDDEEEEDDERRREKGRDEANETPGGRGGTRRI